jgi:hypothetical protein
MDFLCNRKAIDSFCSAKACPAIALATAGRPNKCQCESVWVCGYLKILNLRPSAYICG